jgi:hypothetical protein
MVLLLQYRPQALQLSKVTITLSLNSLWAAFMSLISLFRAFWQTASWLTGTYLLFNLFLAEAYVLSECHVSGNYLLSKFPLNFSWPEINLFSCSKFASSHTVFISAQHMPRP